MDSILVKNWLTTLFGILAGLPTIVLGSGITLNPQWTHYLTIAAGIGVIGLGVVSKAFNVHSTEAQVATSTIQNPAVEAQAKVEAQVARVEAPAVPKT